MFSGLMTEDEQQAIESLESSRTKKPSVYYVPLVWAACLVNVARKEGRIKDDFAVKTLIDVSIPYMKEILNAFKFSGGRKAFISIAKCPY